MTLCTRKGRKSIEELIKAQFDPEALIENHSSERVFIVVDYKGATHSSSLHSIRELPPHTTTLALGIMDPEAVILEKYIFATKEGLLQARPESPLIKTPAGSHISITSCGNETILYTNHSRGNLSWLLQRFGILPQKKFAGRFSNGVFARPTEGTEHRLEYDRLVLTQKEAQDVFPRSQ